MKTLLIFLFISMNTYASFITADKDSISHIYIKSDAKLFSPSEAKQDCENGKRIILEQLEKQKEIILSREDESECLAAEGPHKFQATISILKR